MWPILVRLFGRRAQHHRVLKFKDYLEAFDTAMTPLAEKYGMRTERSLLDARAQASMQVAYSNVRSVRFYGTPNWAIIVYEHIMGPETTKIDYLTIFIHTLAFSGPHIYLDQKKNNRLFHRDLPVGIKPSQLVQYDGFMSSRYNLYAPAGYAIDSLVVAAPDVLDAVDRLSLGADIEILGNQLYIIFPPKAKLNNHLKELIPNGQEIAKAVDDNLSRYIDERSPGFSQQVGNQGRRLIGR